MNDSPRLFTLRLWPVAETGDDTLPQWRGKVQSLPDGEAYYFSDWLDLIRDLEVMLSDRPEEKKRSEP
jgi:hypothetical protein